MLVLDNLGLFIEATIDVAKEPDSCHALFEGDGDVYETEYTGITFQTFNNLCLKSAGVPLYLHNIEMVAPGWGAGKFVLGEFIYFEGVDDATVLEISLKQTRAPGLSIPDILRPLHQRTHRQIGRIPKVAIEPINR